MSYPEDESPWGSHSPVNEAIPTFGIPDEEATPWGAPSDHEPDDYNPYTSTNDDHEPNVTTEPPHEESTEPSEYQADISADALNPLDEHSLESVPVLKPVKPRLKGSKKKRSGNIKTEAVSSDPLAVPTSHLENVNISDTVKSDYTQSSASDAYSLVEPSQPTTTAATESSTDFEISVSDPSTIGDLTNAHTEYTVITDTTYEPYKVKEAAVQRRYRDFRWLYRTLEHNHPGMVIPPPPEKQALGRFNDDFVQFRRAALEQMLIKISKNPSLKGDQDLEAFLTSKDFGEYVKTRIQTDDELAASVNRVDTSDNSNGGSANNALGFIGSLTGALMLSRGNEADPWTVKKRHRLNELETSLTQVVKDLESVSQQRQSLAMQLKEFANVIKALSEVDLTRRLTTVLRSFAHVHERLAQIAERQRKQNIMTLEATLDEHLRLIGSMKHAINQRQRVFSSAEEAASELERKQQELSRQSRGAQPDRLVGLEQDVSEMSLRASELHKRAGAIAHTVETELRRVNEEKIKEFRNSVELYLESTIEAHKETIEVWETFYTRNFTNNSQ